jgi:hypothetical protein
MMKLNRLVMIALGAVMMTACSQNSNPTYPYANNGYGTQYGYNQTGLYNNGYNQTGLYNNYSMNGYAVNPFVNYSYTSGYNAQASLQAQAMFSINFRAATPNFYYPNYANNNCMMRSQVNYTPSSCACVVAPCNCQQVLTQIRQECNQTRTRVTRRTTRTSSDDRETDDRSNDEVVTTNTSKRMSLSVLNGDARALYERLAKEEQTLQNKSKIRTGTNYKCFLSGKAKNDSSYACDFDLNLEDGSLYQFYPSGKPGQPVITNSTLFTGKNVTVGGPGLAPEEGFIKFGGNMAAAVFKRLPGQSTTGSIDGQGKVQAEIKIGQSVKCYKTTNTATPTVECTVKIKTDSGDALEARTY